MLHACIGSSIYKPSALTSRLHQYHVTPPNPTTATDVDHGARSAAEIECEPEQVTNQESAHIAGEGKLNAGLERPSLQP